MMIGEGIDVEGRWGEGGEEGDDGIIFDGEVGVVTGNEGRTERSGK